ncbi:MAG: hypothetical protein ACI9ND_001223 [Yoonia sp.]|jgi:hypothetical protein
MADLKISIIYILAADAELPLNRTNAIIYTKGVRAIRVLFETGEQHYMTKV